MAVAIGAGRRTHMIPKWPQRIPIVTRSLQYACARASEDDDTRAGASGHFDRAETNPRVLLIEDDEHAVHTFTWALHSEGLHVTSSCTGRQGLDTARRSTFNLLLVDLQLPDMSGLDVLRSLRADGAASPSIVVSGHAPVPAVVEAMKLGAFTVLEKPVNVGDFVRAVRLILGDAGPGPSVRTRAFRAVDDQRVVRSGSTAERWAILVLKVLSSPTDPKTMADWAKAASVSRSVICEYCRLVHVAPHDARDFMRIVRAIDLSGPRWQPEAVMDVADARTLNKLLHRAGLSDFASRPTLDEFFERQSWIPKDNPGLIALRALLLASCHQG